MACWQTRHSQNDVPDVSLMVSQRLIHTHSPTVAQHLLQRTICLSI